VWAWGANTSGEAGTADGLVLTPTRIDGLSDVVALAGGTTAAYALKADGTVWGWGDGRRLGVAGLEGPQGPRQIPGLTEVVAIAAGDDAAAVRADGTVWWWGGANLLAPSPRVPAPVAGLTDITAVALGGEVHLAIDGAGRLWSFGSLLPGLPDVDVGAGVVAVTGLPPVRAASTDGLTVWAVAVDGTPWSFGANQLGQCGHGQASAGDLGPAPEAAFGPTAAVVVREQSVYLVTEAGQLWVWGNNTNRELGLLGSYEVTVPVAVEGFDRVTAVAAAHVAVGLVVG